MFLREDGTARRHPADERQRKRMMLACGSVN